jgi:hypothetical protein
LLEVRCNARNVLKAIVWVVVANGYVDPVTAQFTAGAEAACALTASTRPCALMPPLRLLMEADCTPMLIIVRSRT